MIFEALQYGFMQKALLTGLVTGISCSLLGVFLILRKHALIGDGISHISFGGVAAGILFGIMPFVGALVFSIIGALVINNLREKGKLHGDASIGIVSHSALGLGIFIASIAGGFNVDILSYLFGSILAIASEEVILSSILALVVILFIVVFYHDLFYMTFDEESAKVSGISVSKLNIAMVILTAITVVSSMRVVGLMLASAFIILPASSALQLKMGFKKTLIYSGLISAFSVTLGLILSYNYNWAPSGTIILINTLVFISTYFISRINSPE
ncbi:MAG: metal ABC transporter permease [Candidatus Gracilibacteria bacterium]|nr:metal ABC transporter permease [Candidatus Gracilibacteria bacterium]